LSSPHHHRRPLPPLSSPSSLWKARFTQKDFLRVLRDKAFKAVTQRTQRTAAEYAGKAKARIWFSPQSISCFSHLSPASPSSQLNAFGLLSRCDLAALRETHLIRLFGFTPKSFSPRPPRNLRVLRDKAFKAVTQEIKDLKVFRLPLPKLQVDCHAS